jgi:Zn-dependent peptidase ImmA (M78 family)
LRDRRSASHIILDAETARDIDDRVARVLRDLENPDPPLPLAEVRELLSLDRAFYSTDDADVLRETVHRLKVAGKQIILRPSLLLDVVRRRELKALWVPDRRRILIDRELHPAQQRWGEAHEIGHSLIPWHDQMLHGDPRRTLQPACELRLEAEANDAAGRLRFLREQFRERLLSDPISLEGIRKLAKLFGNSVTATLWRAVEVLDRPAFALISQHPPEPLSPDRPPVRHFIRSRDFARPFSGITSDSIFARLPRFCTGRNGPLGRDEAELDDGVGVTHTFFVECFHNRYETLTLGVRRGTEPRTTIVLPA